MQSWNINQSATVQFYHSRFISYGGPCVMSNWSKVPYEQMKKLLGNDFILASWQRLLFFTLFAWHHNISHFHQLFLSLIGIQVVVEMCVCHISIYIYIYIERERERERREGGRDRESLPRLPLINLLFLSSMLSCQKVQTFLIKNFCMINIFFFI